MLQRLSSFFSFAWHMLGVNRRLLYGMWKLTKLPQPAVTFFGGTKITPDSMEGMKATALATQLAQNGFSIITGGGPGIMEAANRGAFEHQNACKLANNCRNTINSFGIGLTRLNNETINPHVQDYILMEYFFERKWLLVRYSVAFVVFPGGFGTLDEMTEVLTLIQCNRMQSTPVILIGTNFWNPLKTWMEQQMVYKNLLAPEHLNIFSITDDLAEALALIQKTCQKQDKPTFSE